jgi:hypothetical protein
MGREAAGEIRIYERRDGLTTFMLRFRAYGRREHVALGTEADGWSYRRAEIELQNTLAKVRAGIWQPRARAELPPARLGLAQAPPARAG